MQELDPARDSAELVVCCEVLEHLEDPDGGARRRWPSLAKPLADRERSPRAAVAGAEHGAGQVPEPPRQHPGAPQPLVEARLRALPGEPLRGRDAAQPDAVDDGAVPRPGTAASGTRHERAARWPGAPSAPAPGWRRSSAWDSPGLSRCTRWAGRSSPTTPRCARSPRARPRSTSGTGRPTTRPGSTATSTRSSRPGTAALTTPLYMAIESVGRARPRRGRRRERARGRVRPLGADRGGHRQLRLQPQARGRGAGERGERRPSDLGADPAGRRDPGACCCCWACAGRPTGSSPGTGRRRRSPSASARW